VAAVSTVRGQIAIAIVDDHPIVRYGLAKVLGTDPEFRVVAEGASSSDALEIATKHRPDLMILDLGIPGGGIEALLKISANVPSVRCMILTVCDSAETAIRALNAGAKGYVLKGVSAQDLKAAIWMVIKNSSYVSPEFATKLLVTAQLKVEDSRSGGDKLSYREAQIMHEVENGLTNGQVAIKLDISEKTVKYYMSSVMQKYGVSNRVSAVVAHLKLKENQTSHHG
jgi:two-component system nitrate/nitrite response regulator NarL